MVDGDRRAVLETVRPLLPPEYQTLIAEVLTLYWEALVSSS